LQQRLQEQQHQELHLRAQQQHEQHMRAQHLLQHQQAQQLQVQAAHAQQLVALPSPHDLHMALVPWQSPVGMVVTSGPDQVMVPQEQQPLQLQSAAAIVADPMDTCTTLTLPAPKRRSRSRGTATGTPPVDKRGRVVAPLPPSPSLALPICSTNPGLSQRPTPASKASKKKKQKPLPLQQSQPQQQQQLPLVDQPPHNADSRQHCPKPHTSRSLRSKGLAPAPSHRNDGLFQAMYGWLEDGPMGDETHPTIINFVDEFAVSHHVLWEQYKGVEPRMSTLPGVVKQVVTAMLAGDHAQTPPPRSRQSARVFNKPHPYWLPPPPPPHAGSHQNNKVGSRRS
jgi:hypothetical protein